MDNRPARILTALKKEVNPKYKKNATPPIQCQLGTYAGRNSIESSKKASFLYQLFLNSNDSTQVICTDTWYPDPSIWQKQGNMSKRYRRKNQLLTYSFSEFWPKSNLCIGKFLYVRRYDSDGNFIRIMSNDATLHTLVDGSNKEIWEKNKALVYFHDLYPAHFLPYADKQKILPALVKGENQSPKLNISTDKKAFFLDVEKICDHYTLSSGCLFRSIGVTDTEIRNILFPNDTTGELWKKFRHCQPAVNFQGYSKFIRENNISYETQQHIQKIGAMAYTPNLIESMEKRIFQPNLVKLHHLNHLLLTLFKYFGGDLDAIASLLDDDKYISRALDLMMSHHDSFSSPEQLLDILKRKLRYFSTISSIQQNTANSEIPEAEFSKKWLDFILSYSNRWTVLTRYFENDEYTFIFSDTELFLGKPDHTSHLSFYQTYMLYLEIQSIWPKEIYLGCSPKNPQNLYSRVLNTIINRRKTDNSKDNAAFSKRKFKIELDSNVEKAHLQEDKYIPMENLLNAIEGIKDDTEKNYKIKSDKKATNINNLKRLFNLKAKMTHLFRSIGLYIPTDLAFEFIPNRPPPSKTTHKQDTPDIKPLSKSVITTGGKNRQNLHIPAEIWINIFSHEKALTFTADQRKIIYNRTLRVANRRLYLENYSLCAELGKVANFIRNKLNNQYGAIINDYFDKSNSAAISSLFSLFKDDLKDSFQKYKDEERDREPWGFEPNSRMYRNGERLFNEEKIKPVEDLINRLIKVKQALLDTDMVTQAHFLTTGELTRPLLSTMVPKKGEENPENVENSILLSKAAKNLRNLFDAIDSTAQKPIKNWLNQAVYQQDVGKCFNLAQHRKRMYNLAPVIKDLSEKEKSKLQYLIKTGLITLVYSPSLLLWESKKIHPEIIAHHKILKSYQDFLNKLHSQVSKDQNSSFLWISQKADKLDQFYKLKKTLVTIQNRIFSESRLNELIQFKKDQLAKSSAKTVTSKDEDSMGKFNLNTNEKDLIRNYFLIEVLKKRLRTPTDLVSILLTGIPYLPSESYYTHINYMLSALLTKEAKIFDNVKSDKYDHLEIKTIMTTGDISFAANTSFVQVLELIGFQILIEKAPKWWNAKVSANIYSKTKFVGFYLGADESNNFYEMDKLDFLSNRIVKNPNHPIIGIIRHREKFWEQNKEFLLNPPVKAEGRQKPFASGKERPILRAEENGSYVINEKELYTSARDKFIEEISPLKMLHEFLQIVTPFSAVKFKSETKIADPINDSEDKIFFNKILPRSPAKPHLIGNVLEMEFGEIYIKVLQYLMEYITKTTVKIIAKNPNIIPPAQIALEIMKFFIKFSDQIISVNSKPVISIPSLDRIKFPNIEKMKKENPSITDEDVFDLKKKDFEELKTSLGTLPNPPFSPISWMSEYTKYDNTRTDPSPFFANNDEFKNSQSLAQLGKGIRILISERAYAARMKARITSIESTSFPRIRLSLPTTDFNKTLEEIWDKSGFLNYLGRKPTNDSYAPKAYSLDIIENMRELLLIDKFQNADEFKKKVKLKNYLENFSGEPSGFEQKYKDLITFFEITPRLRSKIINGANISALQILPPICPTMKTHYNLALEDSFDKQAKFYAQQPPYLEARGLLSYEKDAIKTYWKKYSGHSFIKMVIENANLFRDKFDAVGMDLNRILCPRVIAFGSYDTNISDIESMIEADTGKIILSDNDKMSQLIQNGKKDAIEKIIRAAIDINCNQERKHKHLYVRKKKNGSQNYPYDNPYQFFSEKSLALISTHNFNQIQTYSQASIPSISEFKTVRMSFLHSNTTPMELIDPKVNDYLKYGHFYLAIKMMHIMEHVRLNALKIRKIMKSLNFQLPEGATKKWIVRIKTENWRLLSRHESLKNTLKDSIIKTIFAVHYLTKPNDIAYEMLHLGMTDSGKGVAFNRMVQGMFKQPNELFYYGNRYWAALQENQPLIDVKETKPAGVHPARTSQRDLVGFEITKIIKPFLKGCLQFKKKKKKEKKASADARDSPSKDKKPLLPIKDRSWDWPTQINSEYLSIFDRRLSYDWASRLALMPYLELNSESGSLTFNPPDRIKEMEFMVDEHARSGANIGILGKINQVKERLEQEQKEAENN